MGQAEAVRPARKGGATLPLISVARLKEATTLMERIVAENTDLFIEAGQKYRARHRAGSSRPLDHLEIAALARGLGTTMADAQAQALEAGVMAHDDAQPQEILLAAGVATAPAFIAATQRMVALLEMADDLFEEAREQGTLDDQIEVAVVDLDKLGLKVAKARASAAFQHLADESETDPGKAWGLIARSVWQGLNQAMSHLTPATSPSASSTSSAASTEDSPDAPSSTTPAGPTPGS